MVLNRVPIQVSLHWRYLHQDANYKWHQIKAKKEYRQYSKATICRHMNKSIADLVVDKRKRNKGRPRKLSCRDERNILRQVELLRNSIGYFTTKRIKVSAGLVGRVSDENCSTSPT